jgi:hypothetical protein
VTGPRRERDIATGQYVHEDRWTRLCTCGHTLGVHAAIGHNGKPCFNGDQHLEGATGEACDCTRFRVSRRKVAR